MVPLTITFRQAHEDVRLRRTSPADAARDAARDAERAWQIVRLRAYLRGEAA